MVQTPPAHIDAALGSRHARPHEPQWSALVARSTSQPVASSASQSPRPGSQRTAVHAPATQPFTRTPTSAHA